MKKAKAIELLKLAVPIKALTQQGYADFVEAVNMGIDALEQPTTSDLISRRQALKALIYAVKNVGVLDADDIRTVFKALPTIQPEKAQLLHEGTTFDLISRTETVERLRGVIDATVPITDYDGGFIDGVEVGVSTVSTMPPAQPEPTDIDAKEAVYNLAEKIGIHQLFALTVELRGEPIQPEPHEGRFERKRDGVFCSVCHYGWEFITGVPVEVEREYHYCPNCGARMKGER